MTSITITAATSAIEATITEYQEDEQGRPDATVSTQTIEPGATADFELTATRWVRFRELPA